MSKKPFALVVMPFDKEFDDVYKLGIKPAAEAAGYYCERLEEQIFDETMFARIHKKIEEADIIIGDVTGRNTNVFYEIGYAHALNKRTILLTKKSSDIPFDLTQHFHITYNGKISELNATLTERLLHCILDLGAGLGFEWLDSFQCLQLNINGIELDLKTDEPQSVMGEHYLTKEAGHVLALNVGAYMPFDAQARAVSCEVFLITSNEFQKCEIGCDSGYSSLCSSIPQSDGTVAHLYPLISLSLARGSWDKVSFHLPLIRDWKPGITQETIVTMRFFSHHLFRDFKFKVEIPLEHDHLLEDYKS